MKRPVYHFTPPSNWMNDPNGLIYFGGKYHLFYQHFPYAPKWGTMHWGHAVSDDMVTWEHLPIALFPTKEYDRDGIFSGSTIEKDGKMYIYYTAVKYTDTDDEDITVSRDGQFEACQAMTISEDGYTFHNWDKKITVPVMTDLSLGHNIHTRDPKVWEYKGKYYMILGSKVQEEGNETYTPELLFYVSDDAVNWSYCNRFMEYGKLGNMWECPDIFSCPDTVVVMSPEQMRKENPTNNCMFGIVSFDNDTCTLTMDGNDFRYIDYGLDAYAPQSFLDKDGRRVQVIWLRMSAPITDDNNVQWIGAFALPRVITTENGHIYTRPHPNFDGKFKESDTPLDEPCLIRKELKPGEKFLIGDYKLSFDGENVTAYRNGVAYPAPAKGDNASLSIYIDANIIETYINDGYSVITHVF